MLQQGEYTTVGGRTPIKTDVRIIAATNRDLRQLIQQGLFREDLYYRLNVVPLRLPPLRERVEDIPDLVRHFLRKAEEEGLPHKRLETEALELLKRYRWPGNVRELENLIRRLAVLHSGDTITAATVAAELKEPARAQRTGRRRERILERIGRAASDALFRGAGRPPAAAGSLRPHRAGSRTAADSRFASLRRAATRSTPRICSASIATRCARRSRIWGWKLFAGLVLAEAKSSDRS